MDADHVGALLEQIRDQVTAVAEQGDHLARKQDEMAVDVGRLVEAGRFVKMRLDTMDTNLGVLRSKVVKLEEDVHQIKGHLGLNGSTPAPTKRSPAKKTKRAPKK